MYTGNAMSMLQTQEGTLRSVGNALNRMGELAILAQDITKSDAIVRFMPKSSAS